MQPPPLSPFRAELDRLAAPIVAELLAGLNPLARSLAAMAIQRRGWDWTHPLSTGPLAAVSDAALLRLARDTVDNLVAADVLADDAWPELTTAEALEELRAARR